MGFLVIAQVPRVSRHKTAISAASFLLGLCCLICLGAVPADAASVSGLSACPALRINSSGICVKELQQKLDDAGDVNPYLRVDGFYGAQTVQAVRNFQREIGLHADGIAGPQTFAALQRSADTSQEPTSAPEGVPTDAPKATSVARSVENFFESAWLRLTGWTLVAVGVFVVVIFAAAAVFGVRKFRINFSKKQIECEFDRFVPQRIVRAQAEVLGQYIEAHSKNPGQLPSPDRYIEGIAEDS